MIKSIPFKLSFKIYQWTLLLIIAFSTYLGYQFYQVTFQAQKIENQRFWVIAQLSQYRSRTDSLSYLARQYLRNHDINFLDQYKKSKKEHSRLISSNADLTNDAVIADENLSTEGKYSPFSINERVLLSRAATADKRLRVLENDAILAADEQNQLDITQKSVENILYSGEYIKVNLDMMTLINKLLNSVNQRFQQKVAEMERQRAGLVYTIPSILAVNLVLLLASFLFINRRMTNYHNELTSLTIKDFLTGAHNRKYLMEAGPLLLSLNQREQTRVAVLMLDIDKFKLINDRYGHDAGDEVLIAFSHAISARMRKGDIFSRFGGEEFVLILNKVNESDAQYLAEELRILLAKQEVGTQRGSIKYTVSIGVSLSDDVSDLAMLITNADKALYQAKHSGRNMVVIDNREEFSVALTV